MSVIESTLSNFSKYTDVIIKSLQGALLMINYHELASCVQDHKVPLWASQSPEQLLYFIPKVTLKQCSGNDTSTVGMVVTGHFLFYTVTSFIPDIYVYVEYHKINFQPNDCSILNMFSCCLLVLHVHVCRGSCWFVHRGRGQMAPMNH